MNGPSYYGHELVLTAVAAFCAAINLCMGLMAWDPVNTKRSYNFIFMIFCAICAYYCLGEGLVYSGYFRTAVFFVPSPLLAGYSFPAAIFILVLWFNPQFNLKPKYYLLFFMGMPGTVFTVMTFFLAPELARELANAYQRSDLWSIAVNHVGSINYESRFLMLALYVGFIHIICMLLGISIATSLVIKQAIRAMRTGDYKILRGCFALILSSLLSLSISAIIPIFVPGLELSQLGPIATVPLAYMLYRALLVRQNFYSSLNQQRNLLSSYLPSNLVDDVLERKQNGSLGGKESNGTIMFCDIRNFTAFSERVSATELIAELNVYFSCMNRVIHQHDGVINKYIGDEIMVIFGLERPESVGSRQALECAMDMLRALEGFNATNSAQGGAVFRIGIGLHCGRLVHGNIGDAQRMEYTVLGDTVNTAARITGLTSKLNQVLLCSGEFSASLGQETSVLKLLGDFTLRGRTSSTRIYCLDESTSNLALVS